METATKTSILDSLKNKPVGFKTPPNYFSGFNETVFAKLAAEEEITTKPNFTFRYVMAVAASITLLVTIWQISSFILHKPIQDKSVQISAETKVKLQEIDEIFSNQLADVDESQINEAISTTNEATTATEKKSEIIDYLKDEDIDISDM